METRANYLIVGGFVLVLVTGLLGFVIWLAKFQSDADFVRYDIFFQGSVTGLKVGSPVRYSGVRVGEVIFIGLDRENPSRVRALVKVESITPISMSTVASLEIEGLTGGRYILLSGGAVGAEPLEAEPGQKRPIIPSKRSQLESLLTGFPEVLRQATLLLGHANELLNEGNRAQVATILGNVAKLSQSLANRSSELEELISASAEAMRNIEGATDDVKALTDSLRSDTSRLVDQANATLSAFEGTAKTAQGELKRLSGDLHSSAKAFTEMSTEIKGLVAENRAPLNEFTENGLQEFSQLLAEARDLIVGLQRVTTEVERDPARFLFGDQQQGYEARDD